MFSLSFSTFHRRKTILQAKGDWGVVWSGGRERRETATEAAKLWVMGIGKSMKNYKSWQNAYLKNWEKKKLKKKKKKKKKKKERKKPKL